MTCHICQMRGRLRGTYHQYNWPCSALLCSPSVSFRECKTNRTFLRRIEWDCSILQCMKCRICQMHDRTRSIFRRCKSVRTNCSLSFLDTSIHSHLAHILEREEQAVKWDWQSVERNYTVQLHILSCMFLRLWETWECTSPWYNWLYSTRLCSLSRSLHQCTTNRRLLRCKEWACIFLRCMTCHICHMHGTSGRSFIRYKSAYMNCIKSSSNKLICNRLRHTLASSQQWLTVN